MSPFWRRSAAHCAATRRPQCKPLAVALALLAWPAIAHAQTFKSSAGDLKVETVAGGLSHPWALAFLPDGRMLVTERPGRMRIATPDGKLSPPLQGVPKVAASGQGGLHDVVLDRNFAQNKTIYFCFAEPEGGGARTAMARATLGDGKLDDVKVIFHQEGPLSSGNHFGCRIAQTAGQQSVPDHGRPLHRPRRGAEADEPSRQDRADQARRLGAGRQSVRRRARTPNPKSGATATATRKARRSIRRPASSGSTSTAPRAATRSTFPSPARTTAGR